MIRSLVITSLFASVAHAQLLSADSVRGEKLFSSEHCMECHSVNGIGGHSAPDLGGGLDRDFTPATLVSTMWNHAPTMWSAMRARNLQLPGVDNQAAVDLFAYFYSARFFEKPGDAARGKRVFTEDRCAQCHGITESKNASARPVSEWQSLGNPIALTAAMWNHAASMGKELVRKGVKTPELSGQNLSDLLVYMRNVPGAKTYTATFQTSTGAGGKELFEKKGCTPCHAAEGSLIVQRLQGETLTDVAAQMWAHGLRMPAETLHLDPEEMREVLSYVWAARFFASSGNAGHGKVVFAAKHCGTCHDEHANGAPPLTHGVLPFSDITMVSALWRHGPAMLASMTERKLPWPRFNAGEMTDLIAYLNTRK